MQVFKNESIIPRVQLSARNENATNSQSDAECEIRRAFLTTAAVRMNLLHRDAPLSIVLMMQ